jgi:hypothetical protein
VFCANQVDEKFPPEIELSEMTLIVSIKIEDSIILVADGMGYTHGDENADIPHPTIKLYPANSSWVVGFAGWGGIDVQHTALKAEIAGGKQSFSSDIAVGGHRYISALKALIPPSQPASQLILAGFDSVGRPLVIEATGPNYSTYFPDSISACGAQKTSTLRILKMLSGCCKSNEEFRYLAAFSVWLASRHDLKIGKMEDGYPFSFCILKAGSLPIIEQLEISPTLARMNDGLKSLQDAFASFLSTSRIADSNTSKAR